MLIIFHMPHCWPMYLFLGLCYLSSVQDYCWWIFGFWIFGVFLDFWMSRDQNWFLLILQSAKPSSTKKLLFDMLPVGQPWATLSTVWKFLVMNRSTSAIQEFLEHGLNEEYHNPERHQRVLGNLTGKYGSRIDLKLSTWQMFVRIWPGSLQTSVCLKAGWGQTYGRH